jgi:DNA-binding transcriptional MerR regulator
MINPTRTPITVTVSGHAESTSREIELFEPSTDALYTIETTSRIVDVSRRTILIYCKHHLLSSATTTANNGYYFSGNAIRTLRRIEALRTTCGDDFAGIKIILDLTAALEHLRSDLRRLARKRRPQNFINFAEEFNMKSSSRRKRK